MSYVNGQILVVCVGYGVVHDDLVRHRHTCPGECVFERERENERMSVCLKERERTRE